MKQETPIGLALIICDTEIQDKATNKRSLIGLFDRLAAGRFPCVHPHMSVFVSLTSGRGEYDAALVCRNQDADETLFTINSKFRFQDPMQVVEATFHIKQVRFDKAGVYWLELRLDDVPVMMRRIFVTEHQQQSPQQPPPGGPTQN